MEDRRKLSQKFISLKKMNTRCDITLRSLTFADLDAFMVGATDPEVTHHLRWEVYSSRVAAEAFFSNVVEKKRLFEKEMSKIFISTP